MERESPAPEVTIRPRSRMPVALAVLLILLQLFSPNRAWVILLCGVGGMTLAAYLWARSLARSVRVTRSLRYVWAQVGDLLEERFALHNQGWGPVLWAEVDDESNLPDYPSERVVGASGGQTFPWRVSTVCKRRGLFTLGPWAVHMQDPFGLFAVTHRYEQTHSLLVTPPVMELPSVILPRGVATGRLSYARLREMASRLGVPVHLWDTPAEFAATMGRELICRRPRGTWLRKAMRTEVEKALAGVFLVTKAYEQVSYAPTPSDPALMQRIGQEGWRLRWRLWRLWAFSTARG